MIFSIEYPLSPKAKHPAQLNFALNCYNWLVNHVGCTNIVVGGDSAGGNLSVLLYTELLRRKSPVMPRQLILVSPWLDMSMSHTPPHIQNLTSTNGDVLSTKMLADWRDAVIPSGTNPRDPSVSPFFALDSLELPRDGCLLVYGSAEIFAPVIEDYVQHLKKQETGSKLKVIIGIDMPHAFPIILSSLPSAGFGKANRALFEIARFISVAPSR
jgi:epsilon-lactone hydrolase